MAAPININANLNLNPSSINASAKQVQQALGRITGSASEFQKSLDASTARVFAFGATTAVINGVTQSFKALISTTITVQSKLVEINSILGAGAQEFNKYRNAIFDVAKTTGQSFQTVADGAAELARQGLSATESAKRLEAALILTRISGLGSAQSVKALTAAMNGFTSAGLSAEQVVNKIVAVDTAFAVSAQDLADGFSRAGSTAEDAGVSFDELLGLITAVEQRTARGGAVIGNAFKSIFTRLSRGTTIEDLKSLGVQIDASQTGVQKLQALSKALENISDPTVASQIKELAGGVFQINVVSAALKDIGSESSVFGKATSKAFNATNEATTKNIALNEQLTAQINSLVVSVTSLGAKVGGITFGPLLKNLVGIATTLSEGLDSALDPEKGNAFVKGLFKVIGAFISGPGLILFTVAFAKIFKTVLKFAGEGFKTVMQMGSATEKIKNIEGGIVGLLQKDAKLRKTLASTTATQAQKEKAVISAIQRENALLTQQQTLVTNIANMTARRGVTGYSPGGGFKGRRGKRFSAGGGGIMEPDLETAMINEARDAPRGASPFVTNFRGTPAVMNTSETQVRIGGREEILTAEQADALIPRFNKGSKKKGRPISTGEYAYLVPKVGVRKTFGPMTHDGRRYDGRTPIRGPRQNAIEGASDNTEANLEGTITKNIINGASKWTQKLKPLGRVADYNSVRRGFDTTAGAKGGLKAAIGGAFEVAISRSLDYEAATREKGGDFDVRGGKNLHRVQNLFGISQRVADFKVSASDGNKRSFLDKIRKEKGYPKDGGKAKAGTANVSQKELNAAAAKKARLNVKNRYGNAAKFQQGTTIPLGKYKVEMEAAIRKETERLKRDVYNNAGSSFTNKDDINSRRKRGNYRPLPGRPGRVGRRSTGSLSASNFNSLKRYRGGSGKFGFIKNLFSKKGKGKGKGGDVDADAGGGYGGSLARDIGGSLAFSIPGVVGQYQYQSGQEEDNARKLDEAQKALAKDPKNEQLKKEVKQIEENIKSLETTGSGMVDYATQIGTGIATQALLSRGGSLFGKGKDIAGNAGGKITEGLKKGKTALGNTTLGTAFSKKVAMPKPGNYLGLNARENYVNKSLEAKARNQKIRSSRLQTGGTVIKGIGGLVGGYALDAYKDDLVKSLETEGGSSTNASVFGEMMAGGTSGALKMTGTGPFGMLGGFVKGTIDSGVGQYTGAMDQLDRLQEEQEVRDTIAGSRVERRNLEAEFGLHGGVEGVAELNKGDYRGAKFGRRGLLKFGQYAEGLGEDSQGRSMEKLGRMYGGVNEILGNFTQNLKDSGDAMVATGMEFGTASTEFISAGKRYKAMLGIRDHLMENADAMSEYRATLVENHKELKKLAEGSLSGFIKSGEKSLQKNKDRGDFLGAMTGPNMKNAQLSNKVQGIFTGLVLDEARMNQIPNQSETIQGMLPDDPAKAAFMAKNGIEAKPGVNKFGDAETQNEADNRAIAEHFKKQVEEAGKVFNANVRSGAKTLIMERIAITERIKQLQGDKRELTGGIDPNTGKVVQGSINSQGVSEIVTGAKQGPIDAGRVRSIVGNLEKARESGDMDKFQMAMSTLNGELQGRLQGNEDAVLKQFGFDLSDPKNKAFFDKARKDSVVTDGEGGFAKKGDSDFIMGLGGSGKDEKRAGEIDDEIEDNKKRAKYLDDQIGKLGDQFGKEVVEELQRSAEQARRMADGLNAAGEATSGLVDVATKIQKLRTDALAIIERDKAIIAKLAASNKANTEKIQDITSALAPLIGEAAAPPPTPTEGGE